MSDDVPRRLCLPVCVLFVLLLFGPARARVAESTIGLVTAEDDFHAALREIDPWIGRLTSAPTPEVQQAIGEEIASRFGGTPASNACSATATPRCATSSCLCSSLRAGRCAPVRSTP